LSGYLASSEHRLETVMLVVLAIAVAGVMLAESAVLVGVVRMIGSAK
jgi:hypothetical protein